MDCISKRVAALAVSQTLAMSQRSQELRAAGVDVINLSVGEPDFDTPAHIKEAAKKAIDDNFTRYTPVPGYMTLRQAIADKLSRENGLHFDPAQIVVGNGAKQELCNVILATVNPGDEVIIPTPAWVSYVEMVKLAEGHVVELPTGIDTDFKLSPERLEAAITPRTRMIMFCSPSNPTGSVYTRAELEALAEVLARHPHVLVLADEIYEHINYTGTFTSMASLPGLEGRVIVINGVSKAYAMTGWRIGYCAAPLPIAKAVSKLQGQYTSGVSSIAQKAAEAAYTGPQQCVADMREAFRRRRDLVVELARRIPGLKVNEPQGAFYLFPEVSSYLGTRTPDGRAIDTDTDLAMYLLDDAHVATVAGSAFGTPGYIRFSYATSDDNLREAMRRIAEALGRLEGRKG
ncbi:MAG: pyridoxal phosphate-dependent aminotransferase [Muribaculaceae bacterium]|jgi:aspartate aminotransferase|nr:pyridoxal phosphate-dependent aminotransferase [Muribaculaceae bacterium]MCI9117198.1 pyridoxal phosphate-dependent aminotransferase [Muribaculaceae bacterium]